MLSSSSPQYWETSHLGEAALVIEDPEDAIGLLGDEVNAGLVVTEGDLLPLNLLPDVLFLWDQHLVSSTFPAPQQWLVQSRAQHYLPAHLLLLENDLVEEELQVLIGIVDA